MQAVAEDVVEVANLLAGRGMAVVDAFRDGVHQIAEVLESLEPPLRLGRVAPQPLRLHRPPTLTEKAVLPEPREQGCRLGNVVGRDAARVLEGVREGHEQLIGLGRFWHQVLGLHHDANHYKRLDKLPRGG